MSRLRDLYENEITKKMTDKFGYKNPMMVPKIDKIVINMGVGEAKENSKLLDAAVKELETISGQKVVLTRAKNSIANFKLREGQAIGCKVTLRGEKMYEFLDRLVNLALPRVRDFRGVSAESFDDFNENYDASIKKPEKEEKAYQIKGKYYKDNWIGLVQLITSADELKNISHKYNTTITGFVSAVILYALYLTYFKGKKQKNNLRLFLPVNARRFFNSHSLRNFMLYIRTTGEFRDKDLSFDDVIAYTKDTLNSLNRDVLIRQLVSNVNVEKHMYVKLLPLFIKNIAMRIAYKMCGQDSTTISFSNLGLIKLPEEMKNYIERFEFMIGVSNLSPVNIGAVSYNNTFVLSYATRFIDRRLIRTIAATMAELGVKVTVETNDLEVE